MKYALGMMAVAAVLLGAAARVAAQEGEGEGQIPPPEQMQQMKMAMELQARKAEIEQEQQMRQMEIETRQAEMEVHRAELNARRAEIDRFQGERERGDHPHGDPHGGLVLLMVIAHILLTVWVCKDMREQKIGRALWVPIVLLTGVFGAILYAIVRVADTRGRPAA